MRLNFTNLNQNIRDLLNKLELPQEFMATDGLMNKFRGFDLPREPEPLVLELTEEVPSALVALH